MLTVTLNGEPKSLDGVELLSELLAKLDLNAAYFAVAVNDEVVPRSEHATTKVSDGDKLEVIHAVGGG